MKPPLNVLIVEDSENDAVLLELELARAGYSPRCRRVETREEMREAMASQAWDLVVADYVMPRFDGLAALSLVREQGLDLPFIIVSGHITDDTAVAAMKAGAHDYVMKDKLARLGPAVERELREAAVRREQKLADERLKAEHTFRQAVENSVPAGITAVDLEGRLTYVNPGFCALVGWSEQDLIGAKPPFVYWPAEDVEAITDALAKIVRGESPTGGTELRFCRRTGERIAVLLQATAIRDAFGNTTGWVSSVSDITARKRAEMRLAAEHAVTRVLANARSFDEAAPAIVQVLLDALEVDVGTLWSVDPKRQELQPVLLTLRSNSPRLQPFVEVSRRMSFSVGTGLPGRVWQERRPVWLTRLSEEPGFSRRELAARAGLASAVAFPIQNAGDFFGVLEVLKTSHLEYDAALVNMMSAIGSEIGQFIQRRSAEAALRKAHDELELRVQQRTADLKLANSDLQAAIAERRRLEHELLDITEKERRRIGLDLHDDLGQKLAGLALMAKGLELRLARDKDQADAAEEATRIKELVQDAMSHARGLARDLTTLDFKESQLPDALGALAERVKQMFQISCHFKADGALPILEPSVVNQLCKIAQEAVTNAIKHGKAKTVTMSLTCQGGRTMLSVRNIGLPFPDLQSRATGMGLRIMNYRANLIGAVLEVKAVGSRGTLVTCSLPGAVSGAPDLSTAAEK